MRYGLMVLWMLCWSVTSAMAQISIGIGLPGVNIGINLPLYPELVPVPGYPVYYAPRLNSNYFFYDGAYWVYERDNWYASSWYNGPWGLVAPEVVPLYVLRIPVRYYRDPPAYFRGWRAEAPPRWGNHWGNEWEQRRRGWDKWNRSSVPAPAPLPVYQRKYSGDRYPRVEQQHALHGQNYRYQPRDPVVRKHYQEQAAQRAPASSERGQQRAPTAPRAQPPQKERENVQRAAPTQAPPQQKGSAVQDQRRQPQQGAAQREQQTPRSKGQDERPQGKGASQEPKRSQGQGQEKDREKGNERGQERNK
ncbi:MAG: hypothetical protein Q7R45_08730 [Sulfuricaulis sp.]|nr:hypothetical protein [Sulfuricaulis sp.]